MSGYIGTQPVPQATQTRETFTATAGQTSFATSGYTPNYLDVWLNGVKLVNGTDFTATNGSDVVLTSGAADGDILEVLAYSTFEVNSQNFTGGLTVNNDNATVLTVDRATSDGTLVDFQKDGSNAGSIGINNADFYIGKDAVGVAFDATGDDGVRPWNVATQSFRDNGIDLGGSTARFRNLYLSGGVYLGGTGAANLLDDYEEGDHSPTWNGGGTISVSYYKYVKIGSMVFLNYDFELPTTSVTDIVKITVPFATYTAYAAGSVLYTTSASKPLNAGTNGNNLSFRLNQGGSLACSDLSGKRIIGNLIYNT